MSSPTTTHVREREADLVVHSVEVSAQDITTLTLTDPTGAPLPPWTPGAHIDLILDEDLTRQYSLCGSPADLGSWKVSILRAPDSRGGSAYVHERLALGATVRVRGPRNHFPLVSAKRYVFIAGGIGITPMLPMIESVAAAGADWHLYYGGRHRASMAFADDLQRYGDRVTLVPQDEAGMLDLPTILGTPQPNTLVYCCGPEPLLAAVEAACAPWPTGALHLERFSAKPAQAPEGGDTEFELVLARSGITTTVPADQSVFDVVRAAGVSVLGSCLEGICGTCETAVVEGEVDHRDSVLSDDEREANDYMMICVSRCRSARLTLDV